MLVLFYIMHNGQLVGWMHGLILDLFVPLLVIVGAVRLYIIN